LPRIQIEHKALELTPAAQRATLTPIEIRARAQQLAEAAITVQKRTFRRWGVLGDWENAYKTMDPQYEALQLGIFFCFIDCPQVSFYCYIPIDHGRLNDYGCLIHVFIESIHQCVFF
jgi:hypothetical protein